MTAGEAALKKQLKRELIYKQIVSDLEGNVFEDWTRTQLEFQHLPPGHQFTKKPEAMGEAKVQGTPGETPRPPTN